MEKYGTLYNGMLIRTAKNGAVYGAMVTELISTREVNILKVNMTQLLCMWDAHHSALHKNCNNLFFCICFGHFIFKSINSKYTQ